MVHVSCAQALEEVLRGRARGADVTAETCPQYLFLTAAALDRAPAEGLLAGRLTLQRYLALAGSAAADLYGLADRKGRIAIGLDADLALWNPEAHWEIRQDRHHSRVDFSSYEGRRVRGKPTTVLVRGNPVIRDGTHRREVGGPL